VLNGIDLAVERGSFLALMGPTGVGKSTLCLALMGIVPQSTGGVISGHVAVLGHDAWRTPVAQLSRHIGLVSQDPESQLFCARVDHEVAFGPENLALPSAEIAERVAWALGVVGMSAFASRSPLQLSGGQKQRVAIAASLALLPEVLILDEPTASLDPVGQSEVFQVIARLRQERRMTIVMASHDAERIAQFADQVAVMIDGRIARLDAPDAILTDSALLEAAGLAAPQVSQLAQTLNRRLGWDQRWTRLEQAQDFLARARAAGR
jgi:energy-coupling factor transporter ATP-binding protein EcfA2